MKIEEFKKLDPDFQQYMMSMLENLPRETLIEYAPQEDVSCWLGLWQKEITEDTPARKERVEKIAKELEDAYSNSEFVGDTNKVDMDKFTQNPIVKNAVKKLNAMKIDQEWMHQNGFSTAVWLYGEALKIK